MWLPPSTSRPGWSHAARRWLPPYGVGSFLTMFTFKGRLWLHSGDSPWHFITLPTDVADAIDDTVLSRRRGFGSLRVGVTVGATSWDTSIFPDKKAGSFVLPVKNQVRAAEGLVEGDEVEVAIRLLDV